MYLSPAPFVHHRIFRPLASSFIQVSSPLYFILFLLLVIVISLLHLFLYSLKIIKLFRICIERYQTSTAQKLKTASTSREISSNRTRPSSSSPPKTPSMSLPPPSSSTSTSHLPEESRTIKQRQISHLAQQLQVLASRTEQLERLTCTTAEQGSHMRLLGGLHASWFVLLLLIFEGWAGRSACWWEGS